MNADTLNGSGQLDFGHLMVEQWVKRYSCRLDTDVVKNKNKKLRCLDSSDKELIPKTYSGNTRFVSQGSNVWPVHMSLRMSRISRPLLMGRKPVQKQK